ncbi:MAG TPA: hypothetical protein VD813_06750 [Pseudonocardia sp.]|nr:hypothetical protein [Pseudonocardia sp.]
MSSPGPDPVVEVSVEGGEVMVGRRDAETPWSAAAETPRSAA